MRILIANVNTTEAITEAIAEQARAVAAFVPAALLAIVLALVPNFHGIAPFSWLIGAGIAAAIYLLIAPRNRQYHDVSGECIAVDHSCH